MATVQWSRAYGTAFSACRRAGGWGRGWGWGRGGGVSPLVCKISRPLQLCRVEGEGEGDTHTSIHRHTHARMHARTHTHTHTVTHSFETMVGGSWRWSPASTHLGAWSSGIQHDTSRDWAHSSMTTTSKWPTGRHLRTYQ